jgi:hypothetical protein
LGIDHPVYARGLENLAKTLRVMGRLEESLTAAQAALRVHEAKLGLAHFWTRESATSVTKALSALGHAERSAAVRDHSSLATG